MPPNSLYERDFFEWVTVQAELLRTRKLSDLDVDHLTEEMEAIGRSQLHEVRRHLTKILRHLLRWKYLPELRTPAAAKALAAQRDELAAVLDSSPSLRAMVSETLPRAYQVGRDWVAQESGMQRLPHLCEWTDGEILDPEFLP
jgi:hypothetical protein